jgi:hypothetical protein
MTTVILLLGLVARTADVPTDAPHHRRVPCGGDLDALVIDRKPPAGEAPESEALALAGEQAAILSAYAATDDVLPVALGAAFSRDTALHVHLAAAAPRIAADRSALAGMAEYVVAIGISGDGAVTPDPAPSGYLRRKQAERETSRGRDVARRDFAARVVAALVAAGASLALPRAPQSAALVSVSALLPRNSASQVAAALAALAPEAGQLGLELRMIGPCAPFSFVQGEVACG